MNVPEEGYEVLERAAETVDGPRHHHIELASGGILEHPIKLRPLVAALGAADAVVDVLARDPPPGALGDLPQGQEPCFGVLMPA